jgi:23S rRNA (cytosine1962-C5)-methyltransferase
LLGGATRAVNVDLSRKVLDWGAGNVTLNGFTPDRRDFIAGDCFDWLARFAKKGETFGMVVLDPPSFSNAGDSRFRAESDYARLVEAAAKVLAPKGLLLASCNLEALGASQFERQVQLGLGGRGKKLASFGASPIDFAQPSALKVLALKV